MNITLTLTEDEAEIIARCSETFRYILARKLAEAQSILAKKVDPSETKLLDSLRQYVRTNFGTTTKVSGIKYVRQWAADNQRFISSATYESLFSLVNAKKFVEDTIQY